MTPYCVIGCTGGTGLQIARQFAARGAAVRCIAPDPARARDLLPVGFDIRTGDVNQRERDGYLRNSGLDWSIGRGAVLTNGAGGRADIRITPPVHRLSLPSRVTRPDFARALIAAADAPAASRRMFDVFNEPGPPPADEALTAQLERLGQPALPGTDAGRSPDDQPGVGTWSF